MCSPAKDSYDVRLGNAFLDKFILSVFSAAGEVSTSRNLFIKIYLGYTIDVTNIEISFMH